jgi:acyl-CoA hydrolase
LGRASFSDGAFNGGPVTLTHASTDTAAPDAAGGAGGSDQITLRFLAAPTDVTGQGDSVPGGRVLEWIDRAGYACAVGWSGAYCVTAYVGNVHFTTPIRPGDLVEVRARIILTGRSSMHVLVTVDVSAVRSGHYRPALNCILIMVAVDDRGRPQPVRQWVPESVPQLELQDLATVRIAPRRAIERAMSEAEYSESGTTPRVVLRFLAAPGDANLGGNAHGGIVMRWIDEAAYAVAAQWSSHDPVAVYSGGIHFHRPIHIGELVELDARLIHTELRSLHISIRVRSAPIARPQELTLTTTCMSIFVDRDESGRAAAVAPLILHSHEDYQLDAHAQRLIELREGMPAIPL